MRLAASSIRIKKLYLLTYMRVFGFEQKTPPSQDGYIEHCNKCWFPMILQPKEVVFHDLLFLFMPSPSRYGRKREGHPCIEKGINMTVSTLIEMIVEIREIALFTRAEQRLVVL